MRISARRSVDGGNATVHSLPPAGVVSLVISGTGHARTTSNGSRIVRLSTAPKRIPLAPVRKYSFITFLRRLLLLHPPRTICNRRCLFIAKFHYASLFGAGSELAPNQLANGIWLLSVC